MSYSTINDVFARYSPIVSVVGSGTLKTTSADVSSVFISGADGLIDMYLATRYQVPVPANPLITKISADLAIFDLLVEKLPQVPDYIKDRYDRSLALLAQISSGTLIIASATILTTGDQEAWASGQGYHPIFSPVLPAEEQRVDEQRYDSESSERTEDTPT